ncbi:6-hydroxytryprostatin B O-methyltransferase, partial [Naviculisporaceae sp. PSN 640]
MGSTTPQPETGKGQVSRLVQLAHTISESVSKIDHVLSKRGLPPLSFDEDLPIRYLPKDLSQARDLILDATAELHDLLLEPLHLVKEHTRHNNAASLQAIARYNIAATIPPHGAMSFAELGAKTGLGEQMTARLLRHATTMRIFQESSPGMVSHTRASRMLASPDMNAWLRIGTEEMWPAATKMIEALEKWGPESESPNQTAYSLMSIPSISPPQLQFPITPETSTASDESPGLSNHSGRSQGTETGPSIYDTLSTNPSKAALFASAMAVWSTRSDYSPEHVINGYDWGGLPALFSQQAHTTNRRPRSSQNRKRKRMAPSTTTILQQSLRKIQVLDVGGAKGHVAIALAQRFPHLEITVQDMPAVIEGAEADLPEELRKDGRVKFVGRDLFALEQAGSKHQQDVEGAEKVDVIFLRWVLHNWGDSYCVRILRGLIPFMRAASHSRGGIGTRLVVMDTGTPDPGAAGTGEEGVKVPLWRERDLRSEDLNMAAIFNSRERTLREWKALFRQADERFVFKGMNKPKGSALTVMEVVWTGS